MDDAEIQRRFDRVAGLSAEQPISFLAAAGSLIIERLDLRSDSTLVDLGCGSGHLIAAAANALPKGAAIGVDLSRAQIEAARGRLRDSPLGTRFLQQNAAAVDLSDQTADAVSLNFVLPYADEPVRLLREAVRLAKPGAAVAASVASRPLLGRPWDRLLAAARREQAVPPQIDDRYDHRKLAQLALFADLQDVVIQEIEREFWWPSPGAWFQMLDALALTDDWTAQQSHSIAQRFADDPAAVDEDGQVRSLMKLLILSARAP